MNPNELGTDNVLDYFMNPENVFYDPTNCINDAIKSQRPVVHMEHIQWGFLHFLVVFGALALVQVFCFILPLFYYVGSWLCDRFI